MSSGSHCAPETAQALIHSFEEEQKAVVFSALSDYLHLSLFADVVLVCGSSGPPAAPPAAGERRLWAHRVVLASSSKFFRDLFRQDPSLQEVDLDKELLQNDLALAYEDVQLIIGILYCVGTVEISPPRIKSLLVASQVLGIPTLTRFLKKIDSSLAGGGVNSAATASPRGVFPSNFANPAEGFGRARDKVLGGGYVFPTQPSSALMPDVFPSGVPGPNGSNQSFAGSSNFALTASCLSSKREIQSQTASPEISRPSAPKPVAFRQAFDHHHNGRSPPLSRSHSRNTMVSVGSFSLQQIPSPLNRDQPDKSPHPSRVVSSVLESFDPSFLTNLPANQIDDIENALLPHFNQDVGGSNDSHPNQSLTKRSNDNECTNPIVGQLTAVPTSVQETTSAQSCDRDSFSSLQPQHNGQLTGAIVSNEINRTGRLNLPSGISDCEAGPSAGIRPATERDIEKSRANNINKKDTSMSKTSESSVLKPFKKLKPSRANGDLSEKSDPVVLQPKADNTSLNCERALGSKEVSNTNDSQEKSATYTMNVSKASSTSDVEYDEELVIDEGGNENQSEEANDDNASKSSATSKISTEISVNLESVRGGQSFKFAIPGSSKYVALNFSADALLEMKNSVKKSSVVKIPENLEDEVSSSTVEEDQELDPKHTSFTHSTQTTSKCAKKRTNPDRVKGIFACSHCSKVYPTKPLLEKHLAFHLAASISCKDCGKVFLRRWQLDQHVAIVHGTEGPLRCDDCGREFKWKRNLLAHVQLHHQKEKRHRCKFCPLSFLQRKSYINHQLSKHPMKPPTWCEICHEIFDKIKQKEDHNCAQVESDGSRFTCHQHQPPLVFERQTELEKHLRDVHGDDGAAISELQKTCPVCQKKFLLRKNLITHMQRFHEEKSEDETNASRETRERHACSYCDKKFLYESDCREHENTHTGLKSHVCDVCNRAYSSFKALAFHKKHVHNANDTTCKVCGKQLSNSFKLKYHMQVHSDKRCFKCPTCGTDFKARHNLKRHIDKFHTSKAAS